MSEQQRFVQIKQNIPLFFTLKTLLYIGVNEKHFQFKNYLHELNYNITLLEAYKPNLECYINKYDCIYADITNFETERQWDVVMWWHGPEHISKENLKPILKRIESMANKLVILGCPWGLYKQGAVGGNTYEVHKTHLYPKDFSALGYHTATIGRPDTNLDGSNVLAWKVL